MKRLLQSWVHPQNTCIQGVRVVFCVEGQQLDGKRQDTHNEQQMLEHLYHSAATSGTFSTECRAREVRRKQKRDGQRIIRKRMIVTRIAFRYRRGDRAAHCVLRRPPSKDFSGRMLFDQLVDMLRQHKEKIQYRVVAEDCQSTTGTITTLSFTFSPPFDDTPGE